MYICILLCTKIFYVASIIAQKKKENCVHASFLSIENTKNKVFVFNLFDPSKDRDGNNNINK